MKAYVLHNINDFRYEDVEIPEVTENTVLVKVEAAGICGSDIPRIYTNGTYSYPLIPGHEFSGVVVKAGQGVDEDWLNKRVGIFPLIPCKMCAPCRNHQYEMCRKYGYLGSRTAGGFAEYVRVPVWNLLELPDSVSFEQAAMLEPMSVAVHAMRRAEAAMDCAAKNSTADGARPFQDRKIAICGLGTIGLLLAVFLLEHGVKNLYLIGNKPYQQKIAARLGIGDECYCDSGKTDVGGWLDEKTGGIGADIFFECVGRNEVMELAIGHTAPGGTVLLVGNPASDMTLPRQVYWKILRNQLNVAGTWNSSFVHDDSDDWHYVLDRVKNGRVHPEALITQRFRFETFMQGFELMRDKSEDYVKVMGEIASF